MNSSLNSLDSSRSQRTLSLTGRLLSALNLDGALVTGLCIVGAVGLGVLFSSSGADVPVLEAQGMRFIGALVVMIVLAQIPPRVIRRAAPWMYLLGLILLVAVMLTGEISMGAQRWLDLGVVRFQPSEIMKVAVPLMCAWFLHDRPLPPSFLSLIGLAIIIIVPAGIIAKQPDLGTALLVTASGVIVIFMSGLQMRYIVALLGLVGAAGPIAWSFLHDYQRQRVLTFLNPEEDPLGTGYHIIQSQIAIGSGGVFGKGFMNGSQAQLEFLPERSTDFVFAVIGEEWGFIGVVTLLLLYCFVIGRSLYLAAGAHDTFSRLGAGSLSLTFSVYVLVNTGMVTGLLPVVGVPLPLVSYGGTSMVTLLAGFGILMSLCARRKLVGR